MKKLLLALLLLALPAPVHAQGCGQGNPNCVAPTAPMGDNSTRIANTSWVQSNFSPVFSVFPANTVWAGPTSGAAAAPTARSLVAPDINGLAPSFTNLTVTGVGTGSPTCLQIQSGVISSTGSTCGSGGAGLVNSVSNSDGTLTISPTTGAVVASLALGHANIWIGVQTFPANSLTLAEFPTQANNTVLGNVSGGVAAPVALTTAQHTTLCNVFSSSLSGCVPSSGGGTTNFLRADGSWVAPSGVVTSVSNVDGTLTVSPTSGAVVASLNLAHANTFTATQTVTGPANAINLIGAGTGSAPTVLVTGSDTNINLQLGAKGSGGVLLGGSANANVIEALGASTGNMPSLSVQGTDTNVGFQILAKGTGGVFFGNAGANGIEALGATTGNTPSLLAVGTDTNIGLAITSKGTGTLSLQSNAVEGLRITSSQAVLASKAGAGLGYLSGGGVCGAVTQITNKNTAVTINNVCGVITTSNSSLAVNTLASFTVNDNTVTSNDNIIVTIGGGATQLYIIEVGNIINGVSFAISMYNVTGTATDAVALNFAIIRSANN